MDIPEYHKEKNELKGFLSNELLEALRPLKRSAGETLIYAGTPLQYLMFFVEGSAKVYKRLENGSSLLIGFYTPFDILGDVELFSYKQYIMDVIAIKDSVCLTLPVELVHRHADKNPALLKKLCSGLGKKLVNFNVSASANILYPLENRLASLLIAEDIKIQDHSLGEIAELLGVSYRQLGRVLRRFRDQGIISPRHGHIEVLDRKTLKKLACDYFYSTENPGD